MLFKKSSHILLAFLVNFILSSCATIINGESQEINITIDSNINKFKIYDSLNSETTYYKSNTYEVLRSEKPLYLRVQFDSTIKTVRVDPHTSLAYYLNIFNYGIGYWTEKDIPSKYSYPSKIKLEVIDSILKVRSSSASDAGTVNLAISMPYINIFYLQQTLNRDGAWGFLGIGAGLESFYKDRNYIALTAATGIDFPFFFPLNVENAGTYETENSITRYISLRHHHQFGSFDIGYGVQYSMLYWQKSYFYDAGIPASPDEVEIFESNNIGLSLAAHVFTSEYFKVGFLYQPSIYQMTPERKFEYQHFGSLELVWRIPILKL